MKVADQHPTKVFAHSHKSEVLRHTLGGNTVVKNSEHNIVIKYGQGVSQGEAEAHRQVSRILDPAIIYIPQVYEFFQDDKEEIGYLVMEWVDGVPIDVHNVAHIEALENTLDHMTSFKRSFPGPLHSGEPQGVLWEDSTPSSCNTVEGLENWINEWQSERVSLQEEEFVLCHLDTALENMLYLPGGGRICLLDWASAGYYPRYFELAAHLKKGRPDEVVERLLRSPRTPFSAREKAHMNVLIQACANSMAYARPRPPVLEPPLPPPLLERQYLAKQPSMPQMQLTG